MADPRRMTPEEHGEAHTLLVRAVTDPDWQAASQALERMSRAPLDFGGASMTDPTVRH
jgi:hypothetical protein